MPARPVTISKMPLNSSSGGTTVLSRLRGKGLLLGIQLNGPADGLVPVFMEKGFLINCVQGNTLRFVPPLIIEKNDIDALIRCLDGVLAQWAVSSE